MAAEDPNISRENKSLRVRDGRCATKGGSTKSRPQTSGRATWMIFRKAMRSGEAPAYSEVPRIAIPPAQPLEVPQELRPISVDALATKWHLTREEMGALLERIHVVPLNGLVLEDVVRSAFAAHQRQDFTHGDRDSPS